LSLHLLLLGIFSALNYEHSRQLALQASNLRGKSVRSLTTNEAERCALLPDCRFELGGQRFQMRRVADVVLASLLLAFTLPLMAIVALAIKYESPGPVLTRSERVGIGRRHFSLLKFRIRRHVQEQAPWAEDVTRVGEFIRYTRIEDLPQLFNVLRGDITLLDGGPEQPPFLV
jgi:lipopolysaccharide/colanic/teichoic acid biosynthesis glycosyltransferase